MRYNTLTKFYKKDNQIVVTTISKRMCLPYSDTVYDMFVFFEENIFIKENFFVQYNISQKMVNLFLYLQILVNEKFNVWIESFSYDKVLQNPSILLKSINEKELNEIYSGVNGVFYWCIRGDWKLYEWNIYSAFYSINGWLSISSTRKELNKNYAKIALWDFLFINKNIFSLQSDVWLMYWSWGWFYSVSNIIISKDDFIYFFDKYNNQYLFQIIPWIFQEYVSSCLIKFDNKTSFESYEYHVVLFSIFQSVFEKYWNRWYRYIQIESGAIWSLFRNYLWSNGLPYLELQWFIEWNIFDLLQKYDLIDINKIILTHTICCW